VRPKERKKKNIFTAVHDNRFKKRNSLLNQEEEANERNKENREKKQGQRGNISKSDSVPSMGVDNGGSVNREKSTKDGVTISFQKGNGKERNSKEKLMQVKGKA